MPLLHRHEEIEFNFVERGELFYWHRNGIVTVPSGRMTIFWAAYPHRLVGFPKDAVSHWLNVPLNWFLQRRLPDQLTQPVLQGEIITEADGHQTKLDLLWLNRWHSDLQSESAERRQIVELEIEARLRRLAITGRPLTRLSMPSKLSSIERAPLNLRQSSKAEEMARFIAENYTQPIQVKDIAGTVGLHPNYVMNLFHHTFGMRLKEYLTNHRVAHAQRLIATTDMKFLDIALASGFGSASRFYAAFRRVCKKSPRAYRAANPPVASTGKG